MPNDAYDRAHRAHRRDWQQLITTGANPTCPKCGQPIAPTDAWDLGHQQDLILGGDKTRRQPEHASCNRRSGAALAQHIPPSRKW